MLQPSPTPAPTGRSRSISDGSARDRLGRLSLALLIATSVAGIPADIAHAQAAPYPGNSIYQLRVSLTDQSGASASIDRYAGSPALVSMFFSSCPNVCPVLIDTIHATERALESEGRPLPRVLLVSFDDVHDTPTVLAELAKRRHLDTSRWTLAHASASDVRLLASALGIQYRRLPDGSFNHATLITLVDPRGVPVVKTSKLGEPDPALLNALRRTP